MPYEYNGHRLIIKPENYNKWADEDHIGYIIECINCGQKYNGTFCIDIGRRFSSLLSGECEYEDEENDVMVYTNHEISLDDYPYAQSFDDKLEFKIICLNCDAEDEGELTLEEILDDLEETINERNIFGEWLFEECPEKEEEHCISFEDLHETINRLKSQIDTMIRYYKNTEATLYVFSEYVFSEQVLIVDVLKKYKQVTDIFDYLYDYYIKNDVNRNTSCVYDAFKSIFETLRKDDEKYFYTLIGTLETYANDDIYASTRIYTNLTKEEAQQKGQRLDFYPIMVLKHPFKTKVFKPKREVVIDLTNEEIKKDEESKMLGEMMNLDY